MNLEIIFSAFMVGAALSTLFIDLIPSSKPIRVRVQKDDRR